MARRDGSEKSRTSTSESSSGGPKYYDPAEVDAYVDEVTTTIRSLQARLREATLRAGEGERVSGGPPTETAGIGRALLLAGEVADKTVADAELRAAKIISGAEERATEIIETARAEAYRVLQAARGAARELFGTGEARLLASVNAFIEGSSELRDELTRISDHATSWRSPSHSRRSSEPPASAPAPIAGPAGDPLPGSFPDSSFGPPPRRDTPLFPPPPPADKVDDGHGVDGRRGPPRADGQ